MSRRSSHRNIAVFILDENINGFRWHLSDAQMYHEITPDLTSFGKMITSGFALLFPLRASCSGNYNRKHIERMLLVDSQLNSWLP